MADDTAGQVVLVDGHDEQIGVAAKLAAHRPPGTLHRALSAFVFTSGGDLLLQRRAPGTYHFAGLWSNSCCTHPRPGEDVTAAGRRRLFEELGIHCELRPAGTFTYRATDPRTGLVEHELDHVLVGHSDDTPRPDADDVDAVRYTSLTDLRAELARSPEAFTPWLPVALDLLDPPPPPDADRTGPPRVQEEP